MAKLTKKQEEQYRRFAQEYIKDFNGKRAAIEAGYSKKTASSQASRLLTHVKVQEFLKEYTEAATKRNEITVDRILQEVASIAFLDVKEFYNENGILKAPHEIEETARRAISGIKTKEERIKTGEDVEVFEIKEVKSFDKMRALEFLGKYKKMLTEKVEVSGELTVIDPFKEANE